jgi:hypothetical protein
MSSETVIQIFLYLQVFVIGGLALLALQYARAHYWTPKPDTDAEDDVARPLNVALPDSVKQRLLEESEARFEAVVNRSSSRLQHDLETSGAQIKDLVHRIAVEIVADEMERYRAELGSLRSQASAEMGGIREEVAKHQAELKARMAEEITAEKQKIIHQIDTKLADAVASFLTETLEHNVDLGNQSEYLLAMLEEHKAEFIKGVADELPVN